MMNLIQQQDDLRSMPMQRLMQEAQNPSGLYPQYLVVATIKEKTDMQKRAQAQQQSQQQPQETVSEQVIQEGIMSVPPQQPIPTPTGRGILDNPNIPMNMTREEYEAMKAQALLPPGNGYASGGVVRMQEGGFFDIPPVRRPRGYPFNLKKAIMGVPEELTEDEKRAKKIEELAGYGDSPYVEPDYGNIVQRVAGFFDEDIIPESGRRFQTAFPAYDSFDDLRSKVKKLQEQPGGLPESDFYRQYAIGSPERQLLTKLGSPVLEELPPESTDLLSDEVLAQTLEDLSQGQPAGSTPVPAKVTTEPQGGSGAAVQATDDARNIPVTVAGNDYLSKLMEYVGKKRETLDLSDLRKQERESSFANALVELSAGIAEGDLAKGIRAAGAAQARGAEKARELDQAERLMGYQEEKRAMESDIAILSTLSQLESQLKRASMAAKAQGISGIDFADMMKTASERAEKAVERIANIQKGTPEYVTAFNRALAQIYRQMVSVLPVGVIGTDYSGYSIVPEQ
jgi:hypothetical protein